MLKQFWREWHKSDNDWIDRYKILDAQSGHIRETAMIILQQVIGHEEGLR
jgi:hypothetical protein